MSNKYHLNFFKSKTIHKVVLLTAHCVLKYLLFISILLYNSFFVKDSI